MSEYVEKTIVKKLVEIQSSLIAPKNQFNKFGNYHYRSCEDILEGVKPLLKEQCLILTIQDEIVEVAGRIYVKATAKVSDENDKSKSVSAFAREPQAQKGMNDAQITGSASSYARKYALNGLFCIDDNKDADTNENKNQSNNFAKQQEAVKKAPPPKKSIEERARGAIKALNTVKDIDDAKKYITAAQGFLNTIKDDVLLAELNHAIETAQQFVNP